MNDLGSLATDIVTYEFPDTTGRFPVSFVSGWLDVNIGQLNGVINEEFYVDTTGAFAPYGLEPVEKSIYTHLFEIYYYNRASREVLRGITWDGALKDALIMLKEGDTTIQKASNYQISKNFADMARMAQENLDNLIFQYNRNKGAPRQIVGNNAYEVNVPFDTTVY